MFCLLNGRHHLIAMLCAALTCAVLTLVPVSAQSQAARHREADALALKAYNRMDKGDLEGAIVKFRAAHRLSPRNAGINQHLAELLTATGVTRFQNHHYAAAAARFQEALSVQPDFERAHIFLAKVQGLQFFARGNRLYAAGRLKEARQQFALAVAADSSRADAKERLATVDADIFTFAATPQALEAAIQKRTEALKTDPDNHDLQQKLADSRTALALYEALKD